VTIRFRNRYLGRARAAQLGPGRTSVQFRSIPHRQVAATISPSIEAEGSGSRRAPFLDHGSEGIADVARHVALR